MLLKLIKKYLYHIIKINICANRDIGQSKKYCYRLSTITKCVGRYVIANRQAHFKVAIIVVIVSRSSLVCVNSSKIFEAFVAKSYALSYTHPLDIRI